MSHRTARVCAALTAVSLLALCSSACGRRFYSVCGDSVVAVVEGCDDGNVFDGDGCSGACFTEPGFVCTGMPSICVPGMAGVCGDGVIGLGETCDDLNTSDFDGCSSVCTTEAGFVCIGMPSVCNPGTQECGDGVVDPGEECDDLNTFDDDGCSGFCTEEAGYSCIGMPSVCTPSGNCSPGPDEFEPNDSIGNADIAITSFLGNLCPADEDFWAISLAAGTAIEIDVIYDMADADIDVELQDSFGGSLDGSGGTTGTEIMFYTATVSETVYVRVYAFSTPAANGAPYSGQILFK